jgi:hypothetical protein
MRTSLRTALAAGLLLHLTACGTILHPERKGQVDGRIDAGVAVLDAVGLLFFIIPGVIAFAVDFSNGTIYLPGGKRASFEAVPHDGPIGPGEVERVVSRRTGTPVRLADPRLRARRADSPAALAGLFAAAR